MGIFDRISKGLKGGEGFERFGVGNRIGGRYLVYDVLGGGMGVVYVCYGHEFKSEAWERANKGFAFYNIGLIEEAIKECREAIRINPNYAETHNNLGNALREKGLIEEAIKEFREAIRINPNFAEAHYNLAFSLMSKRDFKESYNEWKRYLEIAENVPSERDWIPKARKYMEEIEKILGE